MTNTKFAMKVLKRIAKSLPSKHNGRNPANGKTVVVPVSLLEDARTCIVDCLARIGLLESYSNELRRKTECFLKDSDALINRLLTDPSYAEKCAKIPEKEGGMI